MKRYMLFAGDRYYPTGGMKDCKGMFDTFAEAQSFAEDLNSRSGCDWAHVFDTVEQMIEFIHVKQVV